MKFRFLGCTVLALSALFFSGCSLMTSEDSNDLFRKDGKIVLSSFLEIDEKAGELNFLEANDALFLTGGIVYASWTAGEPSAYTASNGSQAKLYDTEAYILLSECPDEKGVGDAIEQWISLEKASYEMSEEKHITCSDREYSYYELVPLSDSPYICGIIAFTSYQNYALSIELMFGKNSGKDKMEIMKDFLNAFHYVSQ